MRKTHFFAWHPDVQVVYGAQRAAVYDFHTEDVYSLNSIAADIIRSVDRRIPVEEINSKYVPFLTWLQRLGLIELSGGSVVNQSEQSNSDNHPLDFLWLELGENCNLGCSHCYAEAQNPALFGQKRLNATGEPMTLRDWERVLQQASESGCHEAQFTGGEVLLYRDLITLIDIAKDKGFDFIEVYTNGILLTEQKVKAFAEKDVHLAVSLHGTQAETHEAVTGLRGSFEYTLAGLKRAKENAIPVRIAGVAVAANQNDIINLPVFANSLGFSEVRLDVVRETGSGSEATLMPDNPEVLSKKWLTFPVFSANREDYEHNRQWNPCWAGKLTITNNGDVIPCIMGRTEVVGNVKMQSLREILKSAKLKSLWGLTKDQIEICRDCEYRYVCGDCRPLAIARGDLHGSMPRCTYDPYKGQWKPLIGSEETLQIDDSEPTIERVIKPPSDGKVLFDCEPDSGPEKSKRVIRDPKIPPPERTDADEEEEIDDSKRDIEHERPLKTRRRRTNTVKFDCDPDR